jgi:tight adherence protein B
MGRTSAYILIALPVAIAGIVSLLSPGYMEPMWETTVGHVLIAVMIGLTVIGAVFLKRIVTIKG